MQQNNTERSVHAVESRQNQPGRKEGRRGFDAECSHPLASTVPTTDTKITLLRQVRSVLYGIMGGSQGKQKASKVTRAICFHVTSHHDRAALASIKCDSVHAGYYSRDRPRCAFDGNV